MLQQVIVLIVLIAGTLRLAHSDEDFSVNAWEKSGKFQGDINMGSGIRPRNILRSRLWPGGIVPYEIKPHFSQAGINVIRTAMQAIENAVNDAGSCRVKFVPRTQQHRNYVYITGLQVDKCWSFIGLQGGPQELILGPGCVEVDVAVHELLHVLGFAHQQSVPYRDQYVIIHEENIRYGEKYNFDIASPGLFNDFGLGYDFQSIMHYSPYAYAKTFSNGQPVGPTITARDPRIRLGRNTRMSAKDIQKLKIMYCSNQRRFG